jgi:hypothetical protein
MPTSCRRHFISSWKAHKERLPPFGERKKERRAPMTTLEAHSGFMVDPRVVVSRCGRWTFFFQTYCIARLVWYMYLKWWSIMNCIVFVLSHFLEIKFAPHDTPRNANDFSSPCCRSTRAGKHLSRVNIILTFWLGFQNLSLFFANFRIELAVKPLRSERRDGKWGPSLANLSSHGGVWREGDGWITDAKKRTS